MPYRPVKGAIWARRYLRKTQKLCFSLSIRKDRLFIRKVVLIQTNFRRNLLCEAKWAVGIKTTAQSGEVSESVPHLQGYAASKRILFYNYSPSLRQTRLAREPPIQVYMPIPLQVWQLYSSSLSFSFLRKSVLYPKCLKGRAWGRLRRRGSIRHLFRSIFPAVRWPERRR